MNKSGSESSIFVWIPTFLVGFILLFFYFTIVAGIAGKDLYFQKRSAEITTGSLNDPALTQSFYSFLKKPVQYNGEELTVADLISNESFGDIKKLSLFKQLSDDFLNSNFENSQNPQMTYDSAWIRIYSYNEQPLSNPTNDYSAYSSQIVFKKSSGGLSSLGSFFVSDCDPNSFYSTYVEYFVIPNKKIGFCVHYVQ